MTTKEQIEWIKDFLKKAWCIDGECEYMGFKETTDGEQIACFQLTDSKRGKFKVYLAI